MRPGLCLVALFCAAGAAAGALPEDPSARELRFAARAEPYKRQVFLQGHQFGRSMWIDEQRLVTTLVIGPGFDAFDHNNVGKVVIVDTRDGAVRETGYSGDILCYAEGRIAIQAGGGPERRVYTGVLGSKLENVGNWFPRGTELNEMSCRAVPLWKRPADLPQGMSASRRYLRDEHGIFVLWLENSAGSPLRRLYLEKPGGARVDVPFNPGERPATLWYVPFEQAYLVVPDLTDTQPIKVWEPRFVRLVRPEGAVQRFSVPGALMDKVKSGDGVAGAQYTRRGVLWNLLIHDRRPEQEKLSGNYLVKGGELVKVPAVLPGPDGCRLLGYEKSPRSSERRIVNDYYVIDVCERS